MQSGLIDNGSGEKRGAIFVRGDGQPIEPICPLPSELTFDPDLIYYGFFLLVVWHFFISFGALRLVT